MKLGKYLFTSSMFPLLSVLVFVIVCGSFQLQEDDTGYGCTLYAHQVAFF